MENNGVKETMELERTHSNLLSELSFCVVEAFSKYFGYQEPGLQLGFVAILLSIVTSINLSKTG